MAPAGAAKSMGPTLEELRERQRTKSRLSGVVYKIGDLVSGRYKVRDIAGSGGAGVVYRAHDQEIDVEVALKVINAKLLQTPEEKKLFSKEMKTAKKLSHQNLVRIFDEGKDGDRAFFTMQFLDGLSLRKIIDLRKEKAQRFQLAEVEPIYNQLCQALDYAHRQTFHGCLKPDNVLVLPDLLKVTDFGIMRGLPRKPFLAIQKARAPNFSYLAPEVRLEVEDLTPAVDVFSLGVVLGEMLTGQHFDENKPEQLTVAKTGLDSSLLKVIRRCLLRAPKERYTSAGELYEDLRAVLQRGDGMARATKEEAANVAVDASLLEGAPTSRPEPETPEVPEPEIEQPTQRLDISKHGPRPGDDEPSLVVRRVVIDESIETSSVEEGGTGTFAAIEDDMIESSAARAFAPDEPPAPIEVPPLAEDRVEGEEATEASMMELSNSEIVLVADPRATNVHEVDAEELRRVTNAAKPRTQPPTPPAPPATAASAPRASEVRGSNGVEGPGARDSTHLGRLDVPGAEVVVAPDRASAGLRSLGDEARARAGDEVRARSGDEARARSSEDAKPSRKSAPPTAPVMRADRGGRVEAGSVPIPRSPTTSLPPEAPPPDAPRPSVEPGSGEVRTPKSRPMTRPRMSAIRPSEPPSATSLFSSVAPAEERDPTGARPLVAPAAARRSEGPPLRSQDAGKNRALLIGGGAGLLVVAGLIAVLLMMFQRQQQQMDALRQEIASSRAVAETARQKEAAAAQEKVEATRAVEAAATAETDATRRADQEAARKQAALDEARALESAKREKEAEEKRRLAGEAEQRRQEALKQADVEAQRRQREEARKSEAEAREVRERAARADAEAREKRLRDQEVALAKKDPPARDDEARKRAEDASRKKAEEEAIAKKKAEDEAAKKKAEDEAKKKEEASLAAANPPAAGGGTECPKGMVLIGGGSFMVGAPRNDPERNFGDKNYASVEVPAYCVDYYEAPNGRGRVPLTKVSYAAADRACREKKKRLCSEDEWEKACKGPGGLRYPYGNQWDPAVCATKDDEGQSRELAKSGTFERCRSGYNVLDMSGNVAEWTSTKWEGGDGYVVKGGAADRPGYDGRCAARKKKAGGSSEELLGYRCCADPGK